ncbi:hypothetical protein YC2023_094764 [Brassica napus]
MYQVVKEMVDKMGYEVCLILSASLYVISLSLEHIAHVRLVRVTKRVHEAYFAQLYLSKKKVIVGDQSGGRSRVWRLKNALHLTHFPRNKKKQLYNKLRRWLEEGEKLDPVVARVVSSSVRRLKDENEEVRVSHVPLNRVDPARYGPNPNYPTRNARTLSGLRYLSPNPLRMGLLRARPAGRGPIAIPSGTMKVVNM